MSTYTEVFESFGCRLSAEEAQKLASLENRLPLTLNKDQGLTLDMLFDPSLDDGGFDSLEEIPTNMKHTIGSAVRLFRLIAECFLQDPLVPEYYVPIGCTSGANIYFFLGASNKNRSKLFVSANEDEMEFGSHNAFELIGEVTDL